MERFWIVSNKKTNFLALSYPNNTINQTLLPVHSPVHSSQLEVTVDWNSDVCLQEDVFLGTNLIVSELLIMLTKYFLEIQTK